MEENPLHHWLPSESLLRKFLLLLALLGLLYHAKVKAQEPEPRLRAGLLLSTRLQSREVRAELIPELSLSIKRHQLGAGPTVLLPYFECDKAKLNGLSLRYQYSLKPESWLKPAASLQLIGQRTCESWMRNEWREGSYVDVQAANLEHYAASLLGLQIMPAVYKDMHISLGLMAGVYKARWTDLSDRPTTEFYHYAPYDNDGLTYRAQLGLSVDL